MEDLMKRMGRAFRHRARRYALSLLDESMPWREKIKEINELTKTRLWVQ